MDWRWVCRWATLEGLEPAPCALATDPELKPPQQAKTLDADSAALPGLFGARPGPQGRGAQRPPYLVQQETDADGLEFVLQWAVDRNPHAWEPEALQRSRPAPSCSSSRASGSPSRRTPSARRVGAVHTADGGAAPRRPAREGRRPPRRMTLAFSDGTFALDGGAGGRAHILAVAAPRARGGRPL